VTALTTLAWRHHPDMEAARAELEVAKAGISTAKAWPNPSFGFSVAHAQGIPNPWTLTYGLSIPIETGGKRTLRVHQAELQVQSAELQVADTAWKLRMGVRAAFVDWQQSREAALAADHEASLRTNLLKLQDRRLALGQIGTPEHAATALETQRAISARLAAQTEVRRTFSAMALAAGLSRDQLEARLQTEPPPDLELPVPQAPPDWDALVHRLDVRRTLLEWDQNETTLRQELARRVPDLQIGPGYSFDQGAKTWILGFTVELPLFDRRQGPIAEAVARRDVVRARLRQQESQALSDADLAVSRLDAAHRRLEAQNAALKEQETRLQAARRTFELGGLDRGELLAAELEAAQARSLAVEAWAEIQRAKLAVEDAFERSLDASEQPYRLDGVAP